MASGGSPRRRRTSSTLLAVGAVAGLLLQWAPAEGLQSFIAAAQRAEASQQAATEVAGQGRRAALAAVAPAVLGAWQPSAFAADGQKQRFEGFKRIPVQYIAALGDPKASSGTGAKEWGLWPLDPGPRGVELRDYERLKKSGGTAPAKWQFDSADWWLEEHGLIMEKPDTPMPPGRYVVTGAREVTAILTVDAAGGWSLDEGKLYDVTHLPCRSARYTGPACSPEQARQSDFPVTPGAEMPGVSGCSKQDYAVLFIIGAEK